MGGGYRFYEDLKRCIDARLRYLKGDNVMRIVPHFVKVSSYKGIHSTGILKGAEQLESLPLQGKNVLIVEDMIDTGLTMRLILDKVRAMKPKSLKLAVAFFKKTEKNVHMTDRFVADYTGFLVPELFVIGYGMDIDGHFRDLPHLCIVNDLGKKTYVK